MTQSSSGHLLAGVSVASSIGGVAMENAAMVTNTILQDATQTGQLVSIVVSIISGLVSLYKLLRKNGKKG